MTNPPSWTPEPEALLAEHAWARRLAHRLVRDAALADDLAQEACVRALEGAPAGGPRAWLAAVVRNLARAGRRERGRRARREQAVARPEVLPSAADALERLAAQQDVVRAVLALEEPYRSTIVLRFYDELPPRRIAARQGVPVATVKTRLTRGLAQLRAMLDREHGGDGRSWALVLLPLATRGRAPLPLIAGALTVNTILKISLVSAALVGAVLWAATRRTEPVLAPHGEALASAAVELAVPAAAVTASGTALAARESVPAAPAPAAAEAASEPEAEIVAGLVIDTGGAPVAGVALGVRRSNGSIIDDEGGAILWNEELNTAVPPLALSAADGRFSFARPEDLWGAVVSQDERWETVLAPSARAVEGQEQIVVVAERIRLAGRVLDESGVALSGVELRFGLPPGLRRGLAVSLSDTKSGHWSTTSDEQGRFAFERLPGIGGASLKARLAPFEPAVIEKDVWRDGELELVLRRPSGAWLAGIVERSGEPVPGAVVALGRRGTKTDAQGRFELHLGGLEKERELLAIASGSLPARLHGDENEDGSVRWPDFVRLELAGDPLVLAGSVVDAGGAPLAGQEVWIEDAGVAPAEDSGFPVLIEGILAGKPEIRIGAETDAQGRFEIGGLEERDYRLRVIDSKTAMTTLTDLLPAGTRDARIVQPTDRIWPRLRGIVVTRGGDPVADARVSIHRDAGSVGLPAGPFFGFLAYGARAQTGADGSFELESVPMDGAELHLGALDVVDPELTLAPDIDPLELRVVVGRWVPLQVRLGGAHPDATDFGLLDGQDRPVLMQLPTNGGSSMIYRQELVEGTAPVLDVGDHATTLVLYRDGEELERVPLALEASRVNLVEF